MVITTLRTKSMSKEKVEKKKNKWRRAAKYIMYLVRFKYCLVASGSIYTFYAHWYPFRCIMVSIWRLRKLRLGETITYLKTQKEWGQGLRFPFIFLANRTPVLFREPFLGENVLAQLRHYSRWIHANEANPISLANVGFQGCVCDPILANEVFEKVCWEVSRKKKLHAVKKRTKIMFDQILL